jgi:hypothetical protein
VDADVETLLDAVDLELNRGRNYDRESRWGPVDQQLLASQSNHGFALASNSKVLVGTIIALAVS